MNGARAETRWHENVNPASHTTGNSWRYPGPAETTHFLERPSNNESHPLPSPARRRQDPDALAHLRPTRFDPILGGFWARATQRPQPVPQLAVPVPPRASSRHASAGRPTEGGHRAATTTEPGPVQTQPRTAPVPLNRVRRATPPEHPNLLATMTRAEEPDGQYNHLMSATRVARLQETPQPTAAQIPPTMARYAHARAPVSPEYEYISPGPTPCRNSSSALSAQKHPPPPPSFSKSNMVFANKIDAIDPEPIDYDYASSFIESTPATPAQPNDVDQSLVAPGTDADDHLCLDDIDLAELT